MITAKFFKLKKTGLFLSIFMAIAYTGTSQKVQNAKPNVLFIVVDDLKPELGCYGSTAVKSPNINALAKSATLFENTYCQQALCAPSRASVLTGLRPDRTQIWDFKVKLRNVHPDIVTLPQKFKQNGYTSIGMGKVFDLSSVDKGGDEISWSVPFKHSFTLAKGYKDIALGIYHSPIMKEFLKSERDNGKNDSDIIASVKYQQFRYPTESIDVPDNAYLDGAMADYAVEQILKLNKSKQPFFMAVGFKKPHLPFVAPKKYWDLYDRSKIQIAAFKEKASNSPDFAYHSAGELRNYSTDLNPLNEKGNYLLLTDEKQQELVHGYYACVSYIDAQIGKLMQALKKTGLDKNTIVVLIGDHGWHLGDHKQWCKHSNFEQATKVPLIIRAPGITKGLRNTGVTELIDIYPTICELANLKLVDSIDGISLVPALKNNSVVTNEFAISQYPRGFDGSTRGIMGYSLRNKQYRLTEWMSGIFTTAKPYNESQVKALELYDYINDPLETKNIAAEPAMKQVIKALTEKLHAYYLEQQVLINAK